MILAERLEVPDDTAALLWDLDGVILDTLTLEYDVAGDLLRERGVVGTLTREDVRAAFPHPIPEAWRRMLAAVGVPPDEALVAELTDALVRERSSRDLALFEGVTELMDAGLPSAVVSNNPAAQIEEMLSDAGLLDRVVAVVGNDGDGVRSKPAPDPYLAGAAALGIDPARCVAIEDSLVGAQAARAAGCHVIGVATGASTFAELAASTDVDAAYTSFAAPRVRLEPGDVRRKALNTPNEFVSHMLEHIAWRLGCAIEVAWPTDDWHALGHATGAAVAPLLDGPAEAQALGMIDDGSAEVTVRRGDGVRLTGAGVDVDWFVGLRCEQLADGAPLVELLDGLGAAAGVSLDIAVTSLEDPHHTWEAIFRGVGVALRGLSASLGDLPAAEPRAAAGGLDVLAAAPDGAHVRRTTAESVCEVELSLAGRNFGFAMQTSESIDSHGLGELVERLARRAGLGVGVDFQALRLSSSHVAAEDVGMTLGAALRQLAGERMAATGIEGAGSSLNGTARPIRVGISFEGRKFLRFVPVGWGQEELRRAIIGQTLTNGLFSEDLDDFLDGFAGGMGCSVVVHWERVEDPDEAWALIFDGLGAAIGQLLADNPARRGVIAGVKGTLA